MLLLRTAVILHLRQNTNLTVFTDFEDPFDLDFQQYVETEKPSFFLSCAEKDDQQDAVYFLEIKNLGVNFADILGMRKTLTTIDCWFLITQPSTEAVMRHVRMLHSQWRDGKSFPAPQTLPTLASNAPTPSLFSKVLTDCTEEAEKIVASAFLVASTLQKHLGLLERIESGKALKLADSSPLLDLLDKVAHKVLINIALSTSAQIPDILDTHFLLQTLLRLKQGGANLSEVYSSEVSQHDGLGADLAQLEGEVQVAAFASQELLSDAIVVEGKVEEVVGELVPIDNPLYNTYTAGIAKKVKSVPHHDIILQLNLQVGEGTGEEQQREFEEEFQWQLKTRSHTISN